MAGPQVQIVLRERIVASIAKDAGERGTRGCGRHGERKWRCGEAEKYGLRDIRSAHRLKKAHALSRGR